MALTPSQRPTREWPLLLLAIALVSLICIPLWQALSGSGDGSTAAPSALASWDAERWGRLLFGPEQIACYCCFCWGAFILLSRYMEVRRQRSAFGLGFLPTDEGVRILHEDARPLQRKLEEINVRRGPFILANMIRLALGKYAASRSSQEVSEAVRTQAEVDQGRLVTSMATVHYLAWAIPSLGFLGTVRGLAGSLTMAGKDDENIRSFIDQATRHLNVAFDCTLIALILSLAIMFLVHSVQREEENLVIDCQQYCAEHLVNRLYEPEELAHHSPLHRGREMAQRTDNTLIGFDLDATRIRAVAGPMTSAPRTLALDGSREDLPMALSLQGRSPEVGRAGLALCRRSPHLACTSFLPDLGASRQWIADRHRLDACQALALVCQCLQPVCHGSRGVVFTVPAYLSATQVNLLASAAQSARLPLLGSISAPLASALAAYAEHPWYGTAVVIDIDDYALSMVTLMAGDGTIQELETRVLPALNLRVWKDRLLGAIADRCIQQSRRDPRASAVAEQCLFDGLDDALDACRQGRTVELVLQTPQWYQNLILQPEEIVKVLAPLSRPVVDALEAIRAATKPDDAPRIVLLTASAGRLPGLVAALRECLAELAPASEPKPAADLGDDLVLEDDEPSLTVLAPDAAARAAHALAARFHRRELPSGHLDHQAPVPPPQSIDAGPARLHFRGQDFLLTRASFILGRQPTCDLVFDSENYPTVSGWHCEVLLEHRGYLLRDRSRHGTLVNDQAIDKQVTLNPGDWIRLGPDGPLLRFLGQSGDPRRLMTTA